MSAAAPRHRVAIVGTGPAGFFAAQALTKLRGFPVSIDLFDRLPTPFGLVRAGVAPDHQNIKAVARTFTRTAERAEGLRFFGGVRVGSDLTVDELSARYDAVIWAVGAEGGRELGVPGEALPGVEPACCFVYWYNGHPDYADRAVDLSRVRRVVVVGNGNVALDVARVLSHRTETLAATDIADPALAALRDSDVEEVVLLGRRGPAQAAFTLAELREIAHLDGVAFSVDPDGQAAAQAALADPALDPNQRRILELLADPPRSEGPRRIVARFFTSPVAFDGEGAVQRVQLVRNTLEPAGGRLRAVPTGAPWWEPVDLVLTAIGYRGPGVPGLPFDGTRHQIPSADGRVLDAPGGAPLPGHYVTGWARRGPTGVVGTNRPDAREVVATLWADLQDRPPKDGPGDVAELLAERGVDWRTWADWAALDALEVAAGAAQGRPRVKVVTWEGLKAAPRG